MNNRMVGADKEEIAAAFLVRNGVTVLERNFRCRTGEIDLVCRQGEYLVFVEVKYRRDTQKGTPQEAVGMTKQKKICRVADYYRMIHHLGDATAVRYDVIAIQGEDVHWITNAFSHIY